MKKWLVAILLLYLPSLALAEGNWGKRLGKIAALEQPQEDLWSGSYIGLQALWLYDFDDTPVGFGGVIGVRKQLPNSVVLGAEVDLSYTGLASLDVHELEAQLTWLSSARFTAGYAVGVFLPYVSAGWALAGWEFDGDKGFVSGFVWGGGLETKLTQATSLKLDWSRYEFGTPSGIECLDLSQDVLSVKLNWRF